MGYSEVYCKLCGVSFNIGRVRQAYEPWEDGWARRETRPYGYKGHEEDKKYNYVQKEFIERDRCPPEAGCHNFYREAALQAEEQEHIASNSLTSYVRLAPDLLDGDISLVLKDKGTTSTQGLAEDSTSDEDYSYHSDSENERLEYLSEDEEVPSPFRQITDDDNEVSNLSSGLDDGPATPDYLLYREAGHKKTTSSFDLRSVPSLFDADAAVENDDGRSSEDLQFERWRQCTDLEHLAGPGCIHSRGYSGSSISADQMRGCNVMQCLLQKESNWAPEPDDQHFELTSNYYLSCLSGHVPSRDGGCPQYESDRHNHGEDRSPDNIIWGHTDEYSTPMPFHPTCFEIFTRVSRLRMGYIDIEGLANWRSRESSYGSDFTRAAAVERAREQWWKHNPGDEFLAANPVLIPGLPDIVRGAMFTDDQFNAQNDAFGETTNGFDFSVKTALPANDPFSALPSEIISILLSYLESRDIARLRLSSRAFRHLPVSLFRKLLRREMPWLWEVWDDAEPSIWAIHTAASLQKCTTHPSYVAKQLREEQTLYRNVFKQEMPEVWEAYQEDHPWLTLDPDALEEETKQEMLRRYRETAPMARLDATKTNWYALYCGITRNWKNLKGLQNRERIWEDIEEIVRRIQQYREDGQVP